jgi:hypothetical protein
MLRGALHEHGVRGAVLGLLERCGWFVIGGTGGTATEGGGVFEVATYWVMDRRDSLARYPCGPSQFVRDAGRDGHYSISKAEKELLPTPLHCCPKFRHHLRIRAPRRPCKVNRQPSTKPKPKL